MSMPGRVIPKPPSRGEILDRARAMVATLRSHALQAERDRLIPRRTHEEFRDAGFYRLFQPARYGGYEMPIGMMVEVAGELGRGCGSSAWIFTNLAVQNWIIGMHHPQAQEDVWGANPDALAASSFPTQGGTGRYVEGGLVLNGVWSFASGIDFADWENLQCFIPHALYKVPPWSVGTKVFSGPALGIARGALEFVVEEMRTRLSVAGVKMAEVPTVQVRVAEAFSEIEAAHALLLKDCEDAMTFGETGERAPLELRGRWRLNNAFAGQLCLRAIERLHPLAGARGINDPDSLFLLAWRDIHAAVSQITMAWDIQAVNAGRIMFGLASLDPRL